jgi:hypothetical protein
VEGGSQAVVSDLKKLLGEEKSELAAIHALWTLQGLGAKDAIVPTLDSQNALLRRHPLLALGAEHPAVVDALPGLIAKTEDPRELLYVLTTAAMTPSDDAIAQALWDRVSGGQPLDETQKEAARLAMRNQGVTLLQADLAGFEGAQPET